jgi:hypothetical protein
VNLQQRGLTVLKALLLILLTRTDGYPKQKRVTEFVPSRSVVEFSTQGNTDEWHFTNFKSSITIYD